MWCVSVFLSFNAFDYVPNSEMTIMLNGYRYPVLMLLTHNVNWCINVEVADGKKRRAFMGKISSNQIVPKANVLEFISSSMAFPLIHALNMLGNWPSNFHFGPLRQYHCDKDSVLVLSLLHRYTHYTLHHTHKHTRTQAHAAEKHFDGGYSQLFHC